MSLHDLFVPCNLRSRERAHGRFDAVRAVSRPPPPPPTAVERPCACVPPVGLLPAFRACHACRVFCALPAKCAWASLAAGVSAQFYNETLIALALLGV